MNFPVSRGIAPVSTLRGLAYYKPRNLSVGFITEAIVMAENVYKVIELVGTSTESWEKATAAAINRAAKTLRDLRVAEVVKLDVQLKNGKVEAYRSRISVSFKYESKH
jgi:flavin-binding protein dodecin